MRERKLNRLQGYDYARKGYYFVTICTKDRQELFGEIKDGQMILNQYGENVKRCWREIPNHFPHVVLDEFIIMPNHVHGIIVIEKSAKNNNFVGNNDSVGNKNFYSLRNRFVRNYWDNIPWQTKLSRSLSSIIRGFKIGVTKYCRQNYFHDFVWQKSFHDTIIRDETSLFHIREYIRNNPAKWELKKDRNH